MNHLRLMALLVAMPLLVRAAAPSIEIEPFAPGLFPDGVSGGVCGFSADGSTMYFVRHNENAGRMFLFQARRSGNGWSEVKLMPFSGEHNDLGGRLSPDGNRFYFTSDRPGGSGNTDDVWNIWFSERDGQGWQAAQPLREINDAGSECCPTPLGGSDVLFSADRGDGRSWWIHRWNGRDERIEQGLTSESAWQWPSYYSEDHRLLFFNSMKRPDGHGGDDIYVSRLVEGRWGQPRNLGLPVNTGSYEDGAILSPDGEILIFNRHEPGTNTYRVLQVSTAQLDLIGPQQD